MMMTDDIGGGRGKKNLAIKLVTSFMDKPLNMYVGDCLRVLERY